MSKDLRARVAELEAEVADLRRTAERHRIEAQRERERAEEKAQGQQRILEMVATGAPLLDTLDALIRLIEAQEPGMRCGILIVSKDGQRIECGRSPTLPESFYATLNGLPITPPYLGSCGEAAHKLCAISVPDVASETRYPAAWRANLLSYGIQAVRSTPIRSSDGRVLGSFAMHHDHPRNPDPADPQVIDIATHLAAIALEHDRNIEALSESEARFRAMADNIPQLAWMARPDGWIFWYNRRWYDYTGTTPEEMQGWGWRAVHHPDHVERVVDGIQRSWDSGQPWEDTFPLRRRDGAYRWFLSRAEPVRDGEGNIQLWFGTNTDITERKRAETHRELLINELNHRVKNTLTIVQSVASQTLRAGCDDAIRDAFENRLLSLAQAHDLLTKENWASAGLRDIALLVLHPHMQGDHPERVTVEGPNLRLRPRTAIALGMALHELATNAAKYGALSTESGRIALTWEIVGSTVRLAWRESGGPPVQPPQRRGFGSRLIERNLARELDGEVRVSFAPEGVVCRIAMPLPDTKEDRRFEFED